MKPAYFSGLDLGQVQDYTALVVLEQTPNPAGDTYGVRHLQRWPLGTPYPQIVADIQTLFTVQSTLINSTLVIDATGVGRPVVDMVTVANLPAHVEAFSITAGLLPGEGTVPKKDLVGAVQALLQNRRLSIAQTLPLAEVLAKEMEMFRTTVTADRNETFASWREKDHDDLLLALALAVWYAERHPGNSAGGYSQRKPVPKGIDPLTGLPEHLFVKSRVGSSGLDPATGLPAHLWSR